MEAERGLGPEFGETLMDLTTQLRGLGTNLNQLAHAANEGRPVVPRPKALTAATSTPRSTPRVRVALNDDQEVA